MIYLTNGNIPLNAAYADEIVQEDNSTYQLTFRFPTSDLLWEKLKEETFLTADDLHGEQDFVIFEVEKKHGYIQVYAKQVFTLLNNYVVSSLTLDRATGSTALSRFAGSITRDNPFSFFSNIEDRHTFNIGSKNAMEAFAKDKHSIIGQWGGDLVRHGYQVRLLKNGGSENESLFMYKKNLSSYQHKTSTKSLKTRITFIATVKGEVEKAPDRKLSVVVDSPLINKYSQIYEDVIEVNDQDVKDEASLRRYGEQYYRTSLCDMMEDSLEIEVVGQSDVPVQMFDIVSLFHEVYNLDVRKKITKYTYSPMGKKLKTIGFGQFKSGLANAIGNAVSDAVKGEAQQLQDDFERQLARELKNADLAFDRKTEELKNEFEDGLNATRAKAEEVKQELSDNINQRFNSFNSGPLQEVKRRAEEALRNAGASTLLAQEAKRIGLDSIARIEAFKSQTTSAQTALSSDFDALKQTVISEVNQASEYRRTTTEALSRMTGQMNGFATKSEVKQDIDGLTQTFAKMKVGGRNYYRDSEKVRTSTRFFSFPLHPYFTQENVGETWTLSFDLKINEGGEIRSLHFYHYQNNRFGLKASADITPSKEWQRFTFTGPVIFPNDDPRYSRGEMALYDYAGNNNYSVRRIKLEKGTLATDWSPAIEDTEELITEAKAIFERTAQGLRTDLSAIQEYVNKDGQRQEALQRYTREESAKQATAVRELVEKDYVGKTTYQETVRAIENKFEAITNPQNGSIATQIANYKTAVDGRFADISSLLSGKTNQSDFQRVKETSQLYERILGNTENGIADKVARMAMTNQLFQVEVGKAFADHQNLFLTSTLTKGFLGNAGIINVANATQKEVTSDFISVDPNEKIIFQHWVTLPENGMAWSAWQFFDKNKNPADNRKPGLNAYKTTVGKQHNINQITVPANAYYVRFSARMYDDGLIKVEQGSAPSDYSVAPNDALEAVKTVQRQLDGSWSVQNINSAGDLISGINLGANGHNRFDGKLTHITGETLIDNAVIKSAMIDKLKTANFESGSVTTVVLDAEAVTADKVKMNEAFANKLVASDTFTDTLTAKRGFINQLVSNNIFTNGLTAQRGFIQKLVSNNIFTNELTAQRGFIHQLQSKIINTETLDAFRGRIGGFNLGPFPQGGGRWIAGNNPYICGMGNGEGGGVRTAFWANWGSNWNQAGWGSWVVTTDGKMSCKNDVSFYHKADFSNTCTVNFYSKPNATRGIWTGDGEINGSGSNPGGGQNAVVWWNQITTGKWRQHAGITTASDRRLKENIEPTSVKALNKIKDLNLVAFDYIKDKSHEEIGLIAQEVSDIVPNAVSEYEGEDSHLTINYAKFIPYLLKAIQELNQKINLMEERYESII